MFPDDSAAPTAEPAGAPAAAWRTTFADLAALLLSFFVLAYAMSAVDAERWTALRSALAERRVAAGERTPASGPARPLAALQRQASAGTASVDYLHALLRHRLDRAPLLVPVELVWAPGAVVVRFDPGLILRGERPAPTVQGELLLGHLIDLLVSLDVPVALRFRPAVADGPAGDPTAAGLRAAVAVAEALRAAGFDRPLAAYALAPDPEADTPTVEIVVRRGTTTEG